MPNCQNKDCLHCVHPVGIYQSSPACDWDEVLALLHVGFFFFSFFLSFFFLLPADSRQHWSACHYTRPAVTVALSKNVRLSVEADTIKMGLRGLFLLVSFLHRLRGNVPMLAFAFTAAHIDS